VTSKTYEALSRISDEEWRIIALDLERYALGVSRSLRWRTHNPEELPGAETIGSIVSKAIEKLFSADRHWDPEQHPDITKYLRDVIDSLLNHLAESPENRLLTPAPDADSPDAPAWETGSAKRDPAADWLIPERPSPEAVLLRQEQVATEDQALGLLIDECADDEILIKVLEAMLDGAETPAEISQLKGIPVTDVYNASKRLDRKLEVIRRRMADAQDAPAAKGKGV
jgi:hypothetical protein